MADARLGGLSGEIVIAMLYLGPDEKRITSHLGVDPEETAIMCQRLRDNGVWKDGKIVHEHLEGKPAEMMAELALMACIAEGWLERRPT